MLSLQAGMYRPFLCLRGENGLHSAWCAVKLAPSVNSVNSFRFAKKKER